MYFHQFHLIGQKDRNFLVFQRNEYVLKNEENGKFWDAQQQEWRTSLTAATRFNSKEVKVKPDQEWPTNSVWETICEKVIFFDLSDNKFKRALKGNEYKDLSEASVKSFFRGIDPHSMNAAFASNPVFQNIIDRLITKEKVKKNTNFGHLFSRVTAYLHLESYLLLGIKIGSGIALHGPVSQFSKPVMRFMRESEFEFDSRWESAYKKNPKLVTDLCNFVLDNYNDNLLVYKHLYEIVISNQIFDRFIMLVQPLTVKASDVIQYTAIDEYGFGAEYKALFDYVIKCIAVEAMSCRDVIEEYFDYLKMSRKIKMLQHLARLTEQGDTTKTMKDIGFVDYRKIEKYPRGLTIRHRIVTRNFTSMRQQFDEAKFADKVDHNYAWTDDKYCVVTATSTQDIKNEGTDLHHCVGSYIDSVVEGRTQIAFMRFTEKPKESLVTLEIRSREIQQARGYSNRELYPEEKDWLEKYAKAKNLTFGNVQSNLDLDCPTPNKQKPADTNIELVEAA